MRQSRAVVQEVLPTRVSSELASSVKADGIEARATIDLRALAGPDGHSKLGLGTGRAEQLARELAGCTRSDDTRPADPEPLVKLMTRGDMAAAGRG
jgi:hypothetical protein